MTCNFNREEILEFIDSQLPDKRQSDVAGHLSTCAECRQAFVELKETEVLWRKTLWPHALGQSFEAGVRRRLSPARRLLRLAIIASVAACVALAVWAAMSHYSTDYPVPTPADTAGSGPVASLDKEPIVITAPDQAPIKPPAPVIAHQGEKPLFHALHSRNPMLSVFVRRVKSGDISDPVAIKEAAQELVKLLADGDGEVRGAAAAALGGLKATEAVPELVKLLADKSAGARGWAGIALAELDAGDKVTATVLADIEAIRDSSDEACQSRAKEALQTLNTLKDEQKQ